MAKENTVEVGTGAQEAVEPSEPSAAELELEPPAATRPSANSQTSSSVVPTTPPGRFQGTITRFLGRVLPPPPPVEIPPELFERLDAVEVQIAGLEELLTKRLEEGEGKTLSLVEKRLEILQDDMERIARKVTERHVVEEVRSLRIQSTVIGGVAIGLAVAALAKALGIF